MFKFDVVIYRLARRKTSQSGFFRVYAAELYSSVGRSLLADLAIRDLRKRGTRSIDVAQDVAGERVILYVTLSLLIQKLPLPWLIL